MIHGHQRRSVSAWLIRARSLLLLGVLATLIPAALALPGLSSDNSVYTYLAEGDPGLAFYRKTAETFGGDSLLLVSVQSRTGSIFSTRALSRIRRLSAEMAGVDGVQRVVSLTTVETIRRTADGIHVGPLMRAGPVKKPGCCFTLFECHAPLPAASTSVGVPCPCPCPCPCPVL